VHGVVGEQVPPEPFSPDSPAQDVRAIRFLRSDQATAHHLFPGGIT